MLSRLPHLLLIRLLWLLALAVLVGASVLAHLTHDGHWVNRGGALIAALAAASVLLQIVIEIGLEHDRHAIETRPGAPRMPADPVLPIDRLARRIFEQQARQQVEQLEQQRLQIVLRVVLCATLGELLHGFGDLAACQLFVACLPHG